MKFYKFSLCALALCAAISCNDAQEPTTATGRLSLEMHAEQSIELVTRAAVSIAEVTGYTAPKNTDFTFTVTDKYGDTAWSGKLTDLTDGKLALDAGTYTVSASSLSLLVTRRPPGRQKPKAVAMVVTVPSFTPPFSAMASETTLSTVLRSMERIFSRRSSPSSTF